MVIHYAVPKQDPTAIHIILAGDTAGNVLYEKAGVEDNGDPIAGVVITREECPGGWAWSWFENPGIDLLPTNATTLTAQGVSLGILVGNSTPFKSPTRITQGIVDLGGGLPLKSLGVLFRWSQTYGSGEVSPVTLYMLEWVAVPYPEPVLAQRTKGTSHGLRGFQHLYHGQLAFVPVAQPVILTLTPDQGPPFTVTIAPQTIVPYPIKFEFKMPANKFKMVSYDVACAAQFYLWPDDCEFWLKEWGSDGEYRVVRPFGGHSGVIA